MKLIYVDESGNTGIKLDPNQPVHLIGAVIVDEAKVRPIENALSDVATQRCPVIRHNPKFEFHVYDICQGRGLFHQMPWESRLELLNELISVLSRHECTVGYAAVDKARNPSSKTPHELAFMFLVERIEDTLRRDDQRGLIIADENKEVEKDVIQSFARYKIASTGWGWRPTKIERIIDSVHFVRSDDNHLIQMADLVAYLFLRGKRTSDILFKQFLASRPTGSVIGFSSWIEANANQFQKAMLALLSRLGAMLQFSKNYPQ